MKYLILLLFLFIINLSLAQSVTQKYNSLYNRYEYFDETGNMIGYRTYNSLLKQWEFYSNKDSNRKADFGSYVPPINLELVSKVLAYKQARYDNLSYNEKLRLSKQRAYRKYLNQKAYTTKEFLKKYDKAEKDYLNKAKKGVKTFKTTNKKERQNILELSDGWYECYYFTDVKKKGKDEVSSYGRFIQIINGNVVNYIGNFNIIYPVTNVRRYTSDFFTISIDAGNNQSEDVKIYCVSDKALNKKPKHNFGVTKIFYTNIKQGGKIDVIVKGENGYTYLGKIEEYWKDDDYVSCGVERGIVKIHLPVGDYEYYAFGDIRIWKGEFTLNENSSCHKTKLVGKS